MGKTRLWGRHVIKGRHTLRRHEGETRWKDSFPWVTCPFLRFASQSTDKMTTTVNVVSCALPLHAVPVAWVLRVHTKELVPASHLRSIISATCLLMSVYRPFVFGFQDLITNWTGSCIMYSDNSALVRTAVYSLGKHNRKRFQTR